MKIYDNTVAFFSYNDYLSNFYHCRIEYDGEVFTSSEQLFMACKAVYFGDIATYEAILLSTTPKEAKRLGRQVSRFDAEEWDVVKEAIMMFCLRLKFDQNPELRTKLLEHAKIGRFVEASPYDREWGVGMREDDPRVCSVSTHRGKNKLGRLLDALAKFYLTNIIRPSLTLDAVPQFRFLKSS